MKAEMKQILTETNKMTLKLLKLKKKKSKQKY